jgi:hypothetical protein
MPTQEELETMPFAELAALYKGKCKAYKVLHDEIDAIRGTLAHRQEVLQKEKELEELKQRPHSSKGGAR